MFQFIFMSMSMSLSVIFTQMNHPLAMGLMLLAQTLMICLLTGMMTKSYWFSYILFLVFIGGLLVLFIYVTSLASNEMFTLSASSMLMVTTIMGLTMTLLLIVDPTLFTTTLSPSDMNSSTLMITPDSTLMSLSKLYNQPTDFITAMLILYLFLTLIAVVKITSIFQGPLRQKN
uniref:NADH-ubiquinone oxidoreductase chain 6 n=1 Tax=Leuctra fusca TaxID=441507 RepID=A0A649YDF2_9NEOP|nr:NADH dehydrogenase subunit 6 [Leuctra fusca]